MSKNETVVRKPTEAEMAAQIAELQAQNAKLKEGLRPDSAISTKISEKGCLCVYGLGRFPVSLYKRQWQRLFAHLDSIKAAVEAMPDDEAVAKPTPVQDFDPKTGEIKKTA